MTGVEIDGNNGLDCVCVGHDAGGYASEIVYFSGSRGDGRMLAPGKRDAY